MTEPTPSFCTVCQRDTDTAFMIHGEAEAAAAFMWTVLDIPRPETGTVDIFVGGTPTGKVHFGVQLCEGCAERLGLEVGRRPDGFPVYDVPQEEDR